MVSVCVFCLLVVTVFSLVVCVVTVSVLGRRGCISGGYFHIRIDCIAVLPLMTIFQAVRMSISVVVSAIFGLIIRCAFTLMPSSAFNLAVVSPTVRTPVFVITISHPVMLPVTVSVRS